MSKISIIVPVYKAEKYLADCVGSILNQSYQNLEVILVDDGSPDSCPTICDRFAEKDSRVRVIHKQNSGVSAARNAGLDAATGDYIAFVDSDDYIDASMYENMMGIIRTYSCDIVMCDCVKEYPDHQELYTHDIRPGFYNAHQLREEYYPHLLMMENVEYPATISNWLLLFRRSLAAEVRYLSGVRYSEDLLFGAQLLYNAKSFYYLKGQTYYHYVMNPQSVARRFVPDKWDDYQKLHQGIQAAFGSCCDFDFSHQIDMCLLFFLFNTVGEIIGTSQLTRAEKISKASSILRSDSLRDLFRRLNIRKLPISRKQKLITWLYKNPWTIGFLCMYYERK